MLQEFFQAVLILTHMMQVRLNSVEQQVPMNCTVAELLKYLGKDPKSLAVELNEQVVPRSEHGNTVLQPGDRIEIVTFVGGG
jgi:thiamine biosynthesis protein ThiS